MTFTLPGVEPVTIASKVAPTLQSASTDLSNDYGTPNVLFFYYTAFIPDDRKFDLDAIQDEFQTWNAWELGQAETQLVGHVKDGSLPSDDSPASRIKRNNYRSKAIEFFRSTSQAWLSTARKSSGGKTVETTKEKVNGVVIRELRSLAQKHQPQAQFEVVLNASASTVDLSQESKLYFTHVYYKYDNGSRRFQPVVLDTTFTIRKQDGKDGESSKDDFTVEVNLSVATYNFDRKSWRDIRDKGEEAIRRGEPIRKQMALDFYDRS